MNSNAMANGDGDFERLFFCVDILSQARAALCRSNQELAADLETVTNTLMEFYGTAREEQSPTPAPVRWENDSWQDRENVVPVVDSNSFARTQGMAKIQVQSHGDIIVDVLTGEVLSR